MLWRCSRFFLAVISLHYLVCWVGSLWKVLCFGLYYFNFLRSLCDFFVYMCSLWTDIHVEVCMHALYMCGRQPHNFKCPSTETINLFSHPGSLTGLDLVKLARVCDPCGSGIYLSDYLSVVVQACSTMPKFFKIYLKDLTSNFMLVRQEYYWLSHLTILHYEDFLYSWISCTVFKCSCVCQVVPHNKQPGYKRGVHESDFGFWE